ncbi:GAF and ANTAR domain-containing protein [Streptantibioticus ferralitis]|uniref:GAF and ANTAR domain-containing protein n=1 Tax=Streptantibioticus ferralitis TaxID=236510 RepID=A0ABT5YUX5_9ACTN|nr:GAF and ANTAR domain-containing protein [Streptantibioticus ferralitis]MDF2255335.1 GAF and ANTAR domain-containing protein [Streptantibioticus ferralitis]
MSTIPRDPAEHPREQRLAETFVELADTLADDFEETEFLRRLGARCLELLDVSGAGLILADAYGKLRTVAVREGHEWPRGLLDLQRDGGPALDCYRAAAVIGPVDLTAGPAPWPRFTEQAVSHGVIGTYAVPLRLRETAIGALQLFRTEPGPPRAGDVALAQSLADAATIGILRQRAIARSGLLADQLQSALDSRVVVEQAKGVLAERWGVGVDTAFLALRRYARTHRLRLSELARRIVDNSLDSDALRDN